MSFKTQQEAVFISGATEMYEVDFGDHVEYYNVSPRTVPFDGHDYLPLPIARGEVSRNPELGSDELNLSLPLNPTMVKYLGDGAPGLIEIRIIRGFGDPVTQPENYKKYWFIGLLTSIKWVRTTLQATIASKDLLLLISLLPRVRMGPTCNNELYGPVCGLNRDDFRGLFQVLELQRAGTRLRLLPQDAFALAHYQEGDVDAGEGVVTPGYFTLGRAWENGYEAGMRHVVGHTWTSPQSVCFVELHSPIPDLVVNDQLYVAAGCNKDTHCGASLDDPTSKFNNLANKVSFHRVPKKNPVAVGFIPYYNG